MGISAFSVVYTACPKAFDFLWVLHVSVVVVISITLFTAGLVYTNNSALAEGADVFWMRRRGDLLGNVTGAFLVYRNLSEAHWVRLLPHYRIGALWL
ncbi:hypothetical protein VTK26DRAFT_4593 [Humicola hyalothermophila]